MHKKVIIAGAGISGLATALGFRKKGWDVAVIEQAPAFGKVGAGILLQANGLIALDFLGVGDKVRKRGAPIQFFKMKGRKGWTYFKNDFGLELPTELYLLCIRRADLHEILAQACRATGVDLRLSHSVTDVELSDSDSMNRIFCESDGKKVIFEGSLLVGADGVNSKVRNAIGIKTLPQPLEEGSIHGVAPVNLNEREYGAYFGKGEGGGLFPLADGSTFWFWGRPDGLVKEIPSRPFEEWKKEVTSTFPPLGRVLAYCKDWSDTSMYIHKSVKCRDWSKGNAVVIGDAAHAMSPSVGQGANSALVDAVCLSCYASPSQNADELQKALVKFEYDRRPIVEGFQRAGENGGAFGSSRKRSNEIFLKIALSLANFAPRSRKKSLIRNISGLMADDKFDLPSIGIHMPAPLNTLKD